MASEPKNVEVTPDSELMSLLDEAAKTRLRLVRDGVRFRLVREDGDIWAGYNPEAARAGIFAASGAWKDIDPEAFRAYIQERRRTKNRPSVRW